MQLIDLSLILPAWLAGVLIVMTHVPLGQQVIRRGIIFIDLAVAQMAGLGVLLAQYLGLAEQGVALQLFAAGFALAGVLFLYWTDKQFADIQEAIIGASFVLAATAGMLLFSQHPRGMEHVSQILNGDIIWVRLDQLWLIALVYLVILLLWFGPWWRSNRLRFYILFALSVMLSVQLAGVFLVFASLIFPALAIRRFSGKLALILGYGIGVLGYSGGLLLSFMFDWPAGATIVWCLAGVALLSRLLFRNNTPAPAP